MSTTVKQHSFEAELKQSRFLCRFLLFFCSISINDLLAEVFHSNFPLTRYLFAALSLYYLSRAIYIQKGNYGSFSGPIKTLIYLILAWSLVMIGMGMPHVFSGYNDHVFFKALISGQLLLYLLPFILLIDPNITYYKKLIKLAGFLAITYLIFTLPFVVFFMGDPRNGAENYAVVFAACSTLLALTYPYHSRKISILMFLANVTALVITAYLARRNQVVYFLAVLFFAGVITLICRSTLPRKRKNVFWVGILTLFVLVFILIKLFGINFNYLVERVDTGFESRAPLMESFRDDFDSKNDWLVGRGINGEVYAGVQPGILKDKGTRSGIENGYYQYILKGGFIYLGLFTLLSLIASFKGFFQSHNILSKAFAAIILINLIDMIGFGVPALTVRYMIVWFAIAGCLSPWLLTLEDVYLASHIGLR